MLTTTSVLRRTAATLSAVCALTALGLAPAAAHDEVLSTSPEQDAVLETAPEQIELSYSGEIMDIGHQVLVTGPDGLSVTEGPLERDGSQVIQPLAETGSEEGTYQLVWRVVSSDGHPIEGTFTYRIGDGADSTTASDPGGTGDTALTGESASGDESTTPMPLWAVAGAGAVLALAVLGLVRLVRGRGTN